MPRHRAKMTAWALIAVTAGASLAAVTSPGDAAGPGISYRGNAYAVSFSGVSVLGRALPDETFDATGALRAAGGTVRAAPGALTLPDGLGTLTVTEGTVEAGGGAARASYEVSDIQLFPKLTGDSVQTLCLPLLGCVPNLVSEGAGPVELLRIALAQSSTTATRHGQSTQIGAVTLLGQPITLPARPAPNTVLELGLLSITLNRQSYDPSTGTASVGAVVLRFPPNGRLSPAITGTIAIASSTVSVVAPRA